MANSADSTHFTQRTRPAHFLGGPRGVGSRDSVRNGFFELYFEPEDEELDDPVVEAGRRGLGVLSRNFSPISSM